MNAAFTSWLLILIVGLTVTNGKLLVPIRAEMKNTIGHHTADLLIDGDTNGYHFAHSAKESSDGMWAKVFLDRKYHISSVVIYNRATSQHRLKGYSVYIKSGDQRVTNCGTITRTHWKYSFTCSGYGDGVEVSKDGRTDYMNLAEIAVYATEENPDDLPQLVLYDGDNQEGTSLTLNDPVPNFNPWYFNDVANSVYAERGDWEVYTDDDYQGQRLLVPEGQKMSAEYKNAYSSARPATCHYVSDPSTAKLRVSVNTHFQNGMKEFLTPQAEMGDLDDKIRSVIADKGDWEVYQSKDFEDGRLVIKEGEQIERLSDKGFDRSIGSLRPICATYKGKRSCSLTSMEIVDAEDNLRPRYTGTEIIGSQSSGSCYGPAFHDLELTQVDSVEESTSIEISKENEVNWEVTASVSVTATAGFLGSGASVEMGVSASAGGSVTMGKSETKESVQVSGKEIGMVTRFDVPGAGIVFGIVDRYEVDKSSIPVKLHMNCPDGLNKTVDSTIALKKVSFGAAHFWSLNGQFTKEACRADRELPQCVENVRKNFNNFVGQRSEIEDAFEKCFADGKGEFKRV